MTKDDASYSAAVTFTVPLTPAEMESILGQVRIHRVRYVSSPFGGGKAAYPLRLSANLEESVAQFMKEYHGVTSFRLVEGYVAAYVEGTVGILQTLQRHEQVLLVDVGAVDLIEKYPGAAIAVEDVYYDYNKVK